MHTFLHIQSRFRAKRRLTSHSAAEVTNQSRTNGCLVTSRRCWPSAADEECYSSKRPSSTVAVNSSELNTKVSAIFSLVHFVPARRNCLFLPPVAPFMGPDGSSCHYIQWTFPALRCSDNTGQSSQIFHCNYIICYTLFPPLLQFCIVGLDHPAQLYTFMHAPCNVLYCYMTL